MINPEEDINRDAFTIGEDPEVLQPQTDVVTPAVMEQQQVVADEGGHINPVGTPSWTDIYTQTGIMPEFADRPNIESKSDWQAALEMDNSVMSMIALSEDAPEDFDKVDPDFDPVAYADTIPDLAEADRMDLITSSRNAGEMDWLYKHKLRQRANYEQLGNMGFLKSTTMVMGAALLDPLSWAMAPIPFLKGATLGARVLRGGAIGAADYTVTETVLHGSQSERDLTESLYGFGATTGFGMVLGSWAGRGAARKIMADADDEIMDTSGGKFFADVEYKVAPSDITGIPRQEAGEAFNPATQKPYLRNVPMKEQNDLMRQHQAGEINDVELDRALTEKALAYNRLVAEPLTNIVRRITPSTDIAHSMNYILREAGEELNEGSLLKRYHLEGIGGQQAIDTEIEMVTAEQLGNILTTINKGYEELLGTSNPFKKAVKQFDRKTKSHIEFSEDVFLSLANGGKTGNKVADKVAADLNKINQQFEAELVRMKILSPENFEEGMDQAVKIRAQASTLKKIQNKWDKSLDEMEALQIEHDQLADNIAKLFEAETARGKPLTKRKRAQKRDLMNKLDRKRDALDKKKNTVLDNELSYKTEQPKLEGMQAKMDEFTYSPLHGVGGKDVWYVPHVFRGAQVMGRHDEFIRRTTDDLKAQLRERADDPTLKDAEKLEAVEAYEYSLKPEGEKELYDAMDRVYDKISRSHTGQVSTQLSGAGKFLAQRKLQVRTEALIGKGKEDSFIETDVATVMKQHRRAMVPQLVSKSRGWDINAKLDEANVLRKKLIAEANSQKEIDKINADHERVANKLKTMNNQVHNVYDKMNPVFNSMNSTKEVIMNWNVMRALGSMPISALPDLGNVIGRVGMAQMATHMVRLATNPSKMKMGMAATRKLMLVNERLMASKMAQLMSTDDMAPNMSTAGRMTHRWATKFVGLTGMNWWNQIGKEFAMTAFADEMFIVALKNVKFDANGVAKFTGAKMSKAKIAKFAQAGIDKDDWAEIATLYKRFGQEEGGLKIGNVDQWRGEDGRMLPMAHKLMTVLKKEADTTIVTPAKGDLPLWMRTHVGSMVGQFKSFGFASTNKILLPSMQRMAIGDPNAIAGFTSQMALGMAAYGLKMHLQGREPSTDMNVLVREAIDRSGYFGIFTDVNAIMEKSTRGKLGIAGVYNLFGIESPELSRYYTRPLLGDIVGPSGGTIEDFNKMIGSLASGEYTRGDISAWRRIFPYQNMWYLRNTLNSAQEVANERLVK